MNQNGQPTINNGQSQIPNNNVSQVQNQTRQPNPAQQNNNAQVNNASQFIKQEPKPTIVTKKKKNLMSRELVTILGVIAIVAILYFTYNFQLNKNLEIVSKVPVAKEKIKPGTKITEEQIEYIDVPASTLENVHAIKNSVEIIGKYVNYDTIIPAQSFFYTEALSTSDSSPNSIFKDLLEQEAAIMINVNLATTYGNSIMPGDVVDIYADAIVVNQKTNEIEYITGPLVTGAKVLAVLDGGGNSVFADHENKLSPSYFVFTLESDIIKVIRKAQKLEASSLAMSIYPVVDGKTYHTDGSSTLVNQSQIVDLIENATIDIKDNN